MKQTTPLLIQAAVDIAERPSIISAMEQLSECLHAVSGSDWAMRGNFNTSLKEIDLRQPPNIAIASLLPELAKDEPLAGTEARWKADIDRLAGAGVPAIFVCTIFRHVANRTDGGSETRAKLERIRRLNLFAAELSHDTGIGVIDIDKAFAHVGARMLKTDYRPSGHIAAQVAGYVIVTCLLAVGLDDIISPEIQERMKHFHGERGRIDMLAKRGTKPNPIGNGIL